MIKRKILKNSPKVRSRLEKLPKVYLIACWARYGVREFPLVKVTKNNVPLVYNYNDHNGTADQWELIPIQYTTTGCIRGWTTCKEEAYQRAEELNKELKKKSNN